MSSLITGSCHCKKIKYTFDPSKSPASDFNQKQGGRCNCSFCQKAGYTNLRINEESLVLQTPKEEMKDYVFVGGNVHHYFCGNCGVHIMVQGVYVLEGRSYPIFTVNLATFDQPQERLDLSEWTMKYVDGLANNWMAGSKDEPWTGGLL